MNESLREKTIAIIAIVGIAAHLLMRWYSADHADVPLILVLLLGGLPLVWELSRKVLRRQFSSDLLAGISIVTSVLLGEYLAGSLVVLMLSGGEALEDYAITRASATLRALAKRMPELAHRKRNGTISDIKVTEIEVGDELAIFPHEIAPVDGEVIEGHGSMDESFLTGEPFRIAKTPGSSIVSGALNGESALTIRAIRKATDSRYAKIVEIMKAAEQNKPQIRRLGDTLGAFYTPVAVGIALFAWIISGSATRFLSVLVVATPCPLLIAIPVSIIGSISLAARRGIILKDPSALERLETCRTVIFDKTGTLTSGTPELTNQVSLAGSNLEEVLQLVASLEQYSKHPLANAIITAAGKQNLKLLEASAISEPPGQGMRGTVQGRTVLVTSRTKLANPELRDLVKWNPDGLPQTFSGLECVVAVDNVLAAVYQFRDAPRSDSRSFIAHLTDHHPFTKVLLVSGDRKEQVQYLADVVGITEVYAETSPEEKVKIVRKESETAKTIFVGDGINDAPALMSATVGVAFGQNSDITAEAASAVVLDASLAKVDELFHIGRRMRTIALQSAVGGMVLSILGMLLAAGGLLQPVGGAVMQEIIDVAAILNALRTAFMPRSLVDYK